MNVAFVKQELEDGKVCYYSLVTREETKESIQRRDLDPLNESKETVVAITESFELLAKDTGPGSLEVGFRSLEVLTEASEDCIRAALEVLLQAAFTAGMAHQTELVNNAAIWGGQEGVYMCIDRFRDGKDQTPPYPPDVSSANEE